MIDRMLDFLTGRQAPALADKPDELELAVAALLIEAGRMDDQFDAAERATIERLLQNRFDLSHDAVQSLMDSAERAVRSATQFFPFTREIVQRISPEDRAHILEMMWEVAYADGVLDPHEDALLRRIAGLIHVPDQERGLARQRALEKVKSKGPWGQ
ncbi:tellurite resistance TerB family protein [Dongia deserti]|uniref:tellurite resistance TerB family protein n=1 Tax=Dongia deserti TaxID=2268030 RepID=UPI000E659EE7|nr:TerB family tellurite resistance protein [Dongia deserti]